MTFEEVEDTADLFWSLALFLFTCIIFCQPSLMKRTPAFSFSSAADSTWVSSTRLHLSVPLRTPGTFILLISVVLFRSFQPLGCRIWSCTLISCRSIHSSAWNSAWEWRKLLFYLQLDKQYPIFKWPVTILSLWSSASQVIIAPGKHKSLPWQIWHRSVSGVTSKRTKQGNVPTYSWKRCESMTGICWPSLWHWSTRNHCRATRKDVDGMIRAESRWNGGQPHQSLC